MMPPPMMTMRACAGGADRASGGAASFTCYLCARHLQVGRFLVGRIRRGGNGR
jgi:hypothetical protein